MDFLEKEGEMELIECRGCKEKFDIAKLEERKLIIEVENPRFKWRCPNCGTLNYVKCCHQSD